jgi:NADPH-dependent 2,4-dienoyl-CoA reductase/sulfur reductase-like enzyme
MKTFVIVGASLAGAKAAEALREEGFDGRIVLLGEEQERPYERPPLSKEYMQGKDVDSHVHEADFYEHQQIELRTGAQVEAIDPQAGAVTIAGGERLDFDALLLATGARPRRPLRHGVHALTASERRVAQMAAEGLSNPQIAQSLFLSPRTVESHLGRVYHKLDIAKRDELGPVLAGDA